MTGILAFCAILVIYTEQVSFENSSDRFSPPQDFAPAAQIDLSTRPYSSEPIALFTLDNPSYAGVFIVIHNIDTTFFDLSVEGPDGFQQYCPARRRLQRQPGWRFMAKKLIARNL